ncbi:TPA: hypothetical protein ACSLAS_001078, partial [Listeria innocua]
QSLKSVGAILFRSINLWIKLYLFFYIFYKKQYITKHQSSFCLYTRSFYQSHIFVIICAAKKKP